MLKKVAFVFIAIVSLITLCSCGAKSVEEIEGKEYDCSQFTALCPSGWANSPVMELNNENALSLNHLRFCKIELEEGAEVGNSLYSNAYVDIGHYNSDTKIYESRDIYQNVTDVELDVKGTKWKGYTGELAGYKNALIWKDGSGEWQVNICLSDNDGDIELDDFEIQAILASLKKK